MKQGAYVLRSSVFARRSKTRRGGSDGVLAEAVMAAALVGLGYAARRYLSAQAQHKKAFVYVVTLKLKPEMRSVRACRHVWWGCSRCSLPPNHFNEAEAHCSFRARICFLSKGSFSA